MLVFCPPPGGTHLLCDPSFPLPVETGRLAFREGPGTWESRGKKMGGSGSKATVLENMIKNFKKRFDGDYGKKMTPGHSAPFVKSNGLQWELAGHQRELWT